ncbi:hypothetical protein [Paludibacterium yongneupense]|uniref:hypothetical protein n=1 Tax=Paludibacterium yongneupense TaxID=400061 RepID=UPI000413B1D2|nr:hypothetical protein [Paludibacterium yongneupense]
MTAATADRNTGYREARIVAIPVAAGQIVHAGLLVMVNANGFALEGKTEADLTYAGRAEQYVDNSAGADGAKSVQVSRGVAFKWANSTDDPIGQSSFGKPCFVEDNQTVAKTNSNNTRAQAGIVLGIDPDGVWVL